MDAIKTYTYKSGAVYEGTFDGNMRSGRGHWTHPQGERYEGEYKDNKQNGLGVYIFSETGKKYLGNWEAGQMNGEGLYFFNLDCTAYYFGNYTKDKKDGDGHYMYETGVMTTQKWNMGALLKEEETPPSEIVECAVKIKELMDAVRAVAPKELGDMPPPSEVRTFQFPSGATYTGQYFGTKKHGRGYWLHPEGDSYEGQFDNNHHSGWGVYVIGRSGKKYVGHWRNGKMNGIGVYFFNPQETEYYVGLYRDDVKNGRGMYHFAESGASMVQMWENGVLRQEMEADKATEKAYEAAIRRIVEVVKPYAPNYEPVTFGF
ncbi:conserved hypothetical protein [Leishmania mexicana MHOM/GT/2001/U1103]|uniref:MORN repeat-containing protein 5 n=1 Tax=Leishmania mexicana (strain MHOM/GT/2001/U1103) TaxID=929439 RepID=E9ATG0_LEIMU|nr:conserved hypothetical protein [Leishmania mexicana MHOM/GT/2001/U1103]CBZ26234.1 conserved hypothetical protein [Leishmania mexicana MHOM/GT/2001/U1103]